MKALAALRLLVGRGRHRGWGLRVRGFLRNTGTLASSASSRGTELAGALAFRTKLALAIAARYQAEAKQTTQQGTHATPS